MHDADRRDGHHVVLHAARDSFGCRRRRPQPVDADQPGDRAVETLDHGNGVTQVGSILLEEVGHRDPAAHAGRIGDHDVAHPQVTERET